ncbi:MAG: hypothetical protein KJ915_09045 [Candidatus Omnitrophica bacterium]|nr:hypothetical protein [Candidatus Omnitrophota bacterium]
MKKNLIIAFGIIILLSSNLFAQEEGKSAAGALNKKQKNKEWNQDFQARRLEALEEYQDQGLSPEEIRQKMSEFRKESKEYGMEIRAKRRDFINERMDENYDGGIDQAEIYKSREDSQELRESRLVDIEDRQERWREIKEPREGKRGNWNHNRR